MALTASGYPLTSVFPFKYLVRVLSASDNNLPAEIQNVRRVRKNWERLLQVIGREGADVRTLGVFYITVV